MSYSTVRIPHKIGSEETVARFCAQLYHEGILFECEDHGEVYVITLKGF
jgi:hypothetical protein